MTVANLDDLRTRNAGFRVRTRPELFRDLAVSCASLGDQARAGISDSEVAGIDRTIEGVRRVLGDLRIGDPDAA